ncbi:MAG: Uncharacterised protein [Flavobacteriaceae bacterium]|nr:MAG: Uncharacterised protein [Flavobacteriaceae bacterium]
MNYNYLHLIFLMATMLGFGQVRVVNTTTNVRALGSSAFIDASSTEYLNATANEGKGLLYPRTDLTTFTFSGAPFGLPSNYPTYYDGFVVYNTASSGVALAGGTQGGALFEGFWYYKNTSNTIGGGTWIPIGASGGPTTEGGPGDPDDPNNPNRPKDPKNGDIYVDESTGDLYTYINNQWTNKTTTGNITADTDATIIVTDGTAAALKNVKLKVDASKLKDIPAASIKHGANGQVLTTDSTGKTVWAAADEADIRKVGANNHISSDAGVGGKGTSVGTGANNFAVGSSTLASNTGGGNNIALGTSALASNTEGGNNIALGFQALPANKTGNANIALGANALVLNNEGSGNIAIGILAGRNNTTGSSNIILGQQSEVEDPAGDNQLSIGNLIFGTGLDGHKFPSRLSTGDIGIGIKVPTQKLDVDGGVRIRTLNPGVATDKIVVADATGVLKKLSDLPPASIGSGTEGQVLTTDSTGKTVWKDGAEAIIPKGKNITADADATITVTNGTAAVLKDVTLKVNTANLKDIPAASIKNGASGQVLTTDSTGKTVWKDGADLRKLGTNNHISSDAGVGGNGTSVGTGTNNFAVGNTASGSNITGSNNIAFGFAALLYNQIGNDNFASGYLSLYNAKGSGNIAIGRQSGFNITSGSTNIAIGRGSYVANPTADDQLSIGNLIFGTGLDGYKDVTNKLSTGNIGIGIKVPTQKLDVDGNIKADSFIAPSKTYADYVFEKYLDGVSTINTDYKFKSLAEVERFIKTNKHLPGVTGINELQKDKDGKLLVDIPALAKQSLEKIEELFLHTIEQQKIIEDLEEENEGLKGRLEKIEQALGL